MLEDFYTIEIPIAEGTQAFTTAIRLNANHRIFAGHFPEQPIVPGVCTLQFIKACAEKAIGKSLQYTQISQVKYLLPIDPRTTPLLTLNCTITPTERDYTLTAELFAGDALAVKIKKAIMTQTSSTLSA